MKRMKYVLWSAAVGVTLIGATRANDPGQSRIEALERKVAELEAKQATDSREVATVIDAVLRDSERRSQLLAADGNAGAGYDNGFYIRQGDSWILKPGAFMQFRNNTDLRNDAGGDDTRTENGFEFRRLKLHLEGTAVSPAFTYFIGWNVERDSGTFLLEDAIVNYWSNETYGIRVGQSKDPLSKEWLTHDGRAMAVERSMVDAVLGSGTVNRTQGITFMYNRYQKDNPLHAELMLHDGARQLNTNYIGKTPAGIAGGIGAPHSWDFGVTGRVEYRAIGDWKSYLDFSAKDTKQDLLVFGGGIDWSQNGDGDQITAAADAQWENDKGCALFVAAHLRDRDEQLAGAEGTDWGAMVQAGHLLNPAWEIFARYGIIGFDNDVVFANGESEDLFHEITVGFNYFLGTNGSGFHKAKVTVDLTYLPNGAPAPFTALGILGDNSGEDEWVLRGQFQLWI
jgi:Phosphate-selective porin O and P